MSAHKDKVLFCSFCGKSQSEVKKLIAGPTVFICDECVDLCMDILKAENIIPQNADDPYFCITHKQMGFLVERNVTAQNILNPAFPSGMTPDVTFEALMLSIAEQLKENYHTDTMVDRTRLDAVRAILTRQRATLDAAIDRIDRELSKLPEATEGTEPSAAVTTHAAQQ